MLCEDANGKLEMEDLIFLEILGVPTHRSLWVSGHVPEEARYYEK